MSTVPLKNQRLPNWTLEETLLAWELFLTEYADPLRYPDATHAPVQQLSRHLRELPLHAPEVRRSPRFRNPAGVARKIQNLMYFATGGAQGSENGSAVDQQVAHGIRDLAAVRALAAHVRKGERLKPDDVKAHQAGSEGESVGIADYARALDALDGELDVESVGNRRVEQRFLRQSLFGRLDTGVCAICGRELPTDLLVAAHIKQRSLCTRSEKLDVNHIVMAACRLGCDELYERGYLAVNQNGVVIAASISLPDAVIEVLEGLEGRRCRAHTDGSAMYFAEHRSLVFLDRRASP